MKYIMSLLGYHFRLINGQIYRFFHKKNYLGKSVFYSIPRVNRIDRLICGDGLKVNGNVFINADGGVKIGRRVTLSYGTTILAASYDKNSFWKGKRVHRNKGIKIGNDVWIGANATILDGVHICDHVIIGAGAVVATNISTPYSVYAGVPAKRISGRVKV